MQDQDIKLYEIKIQNQTVQLCIEPRDNEKIESICLGFANNDANIDLISMLKEKAHAFLTAFKDLQRNGITLNICGKNPIFEALDYLLSRTNEIIFKEEDRVVLEELRVKLRSNIKERPDYASNQKMFKSYKKIKEKYPHSQTLADQEKGLSYIQKLQAANKKEIYLKSLPDRKIINIEAFAAHLNALVFGFDRIPKTRLLFNEKNQRIGILSKAIPGFKTFEACVEESKNYLEDKIDEWVNRLVANGINELLVHAYVFGENDLYGRNFGDNDKNEIVRLDFGQSFYFESLCIHKEDIKNFPQLTHANPQHWLPRGYAMLNKNSYSPQTIKIFEKIRNHPDSQKRIDEAFLKDILLPADAIEAGAKATFSKQSDQEIYREIIDRLKKTKDILLEDVGFICRLNEHAEEFEKNIIGFYEKNNALIKEKSAFLRVDIEIVKRHFLHIKKYAQDFVHKLTSLNILTLNDMLQVTQIDPDNLHLAANKVLKAAEIFDGFFSLENILALENESSIKAFQKALLNDFLKLNLTPEEVKNYLRRFTEIYGVLLEGEANKRSEKKYNFILDVLIQAGFKKGMNYGDIIESIRALPTDQIRKADKLLINLEHHVIDLKLKELGKNHSDFKNKNIIIEKTAALSILNQQISLLKKQIDRRKEDLNSCFVFKRSILKEKVKALKILISRFEIAQKNISAKCGLNASEQEKIFSNLKVLIKFWNENYKEKIEAHRYPAFLRIFNSHDKPHIVKQTENIIAQICPENPPIGL